MFKKKKKNELELEESQRMIGRNLPFAASEAYKRLRTNLMFSLPDATNCKIIGVTSAMRGEGKSTTSINIAYSMAQIGKKVLLLEADLRLPTISKKMNISPNPGISNLLVGQADGREVLQKSGIINNFWVITAGSTVPNPAEMLASHQMMAVIEALKSNFDVIIIDLPPVTAVADALLMSQIVNGMIVVVRQNYCDKRFLDDSIQQMKFAGTKILGFVMTGGETQIKGYRHYGTYGVYK